MLKIMRNNVVVVNNDEELKGLEKNNDKCYLVESCDFLLRFSQYFSSSIC